MTYVLAAIGIVLWLAVLGALQQIVNVLQRLVDLARQQDLRAHEQYTFARSERASDVARADTLTQAQLRIAAAQCDVAQRQADALADQAAYRDEQRRHMASCAKRYEALLAGELAPSETPVKH
jgi:uncharacterized membrane protein YhiD involved in acid resistance